MPSTRARRILETQGGLARLAAPTLALLAFVLVLAGCTSQPEAAGPAEVLAEYQEAGDAGDIDAVMELFTEDAVVTGHPLDETSPPIATGVEEIRPLEEQVIALQRSEDANEYFDVEVTGNTATFSSHFYANDGLCYAGSGHEITVADRKITTYAWGTSNQPCDP